MEDLFDGIVEELSWCSGKLTKFGDRKRKLRATGR
jgi:hypothetical protein